MITIDNIRTILCDMPTTVKGYTIATNDGFYTVILNQNLSYSQNMKTYQHEISHIINNDYGKSCSADMIELKAHK